MLTFESLLLIYQTIDKNGDHIKGLYENIFERTAVIMAANSNLDHVKGALILSQACLTTIRSQSDLTYLFGKVSQILTGLAEQSLSML